MAITINRTMSDGGQTASFEVVSTGDSPAESGTVVDISTLSGGLGDGSERVRVTRVESFVCGDGSTAGTSLSLSWGGDDVFLTLPEGVFSQNITFWPTAMTDAADAGDINFQATVNTPFTLRLYVEKAEGFPLSVARGL